MSLDDYDLDGKDLWGISKGDQKIKIQLHVACCSTFIIENPLFLKLIFHTEELFEIKDKKSKIYQKNETIFVT